MQEPDTAERYLGIAKELGISVSGEDILSFLQIKEKIQLEKAAKVEEIVKEALDEEALENVFGGADSCADTYSEGEWCWFTDSCSMLICGYDAADRVAGSAGSGFSRGSFVCIAADLDEMEFSVDQIIAGEHFDAGYEFNPEEIIRGRHFSGDGYEPIC